MYSMEVWFVVIATCTTRKEKRGVFRLAEWMTACLYVRAAVKKGRKVVRVPFFVLKWVVYSHTHLHALLHLLIQHFCGFSKLSTFLFIFLDFTIFSFFFALLIFWYNILQLVMFSVVSCGWRGVLACYLNGGCFLSVWKVVMVVVLVFSSALDHHQEYGFGFRRFFFVFEKKIFLLFYFAALLSNSRLAGSSFITITNNRKLGFWLWLLHFYNWWSL